jgi:adenine phosphoribosyltransferase
VDLREFIRDVPDFPRPGIVFRDLTPLFLDPKLLDHTISELAERAPEVDVVVAAEARGFILGPAIAQRIGAGFIPARKPGKLPRATSSAEYALEYGVDALHVHADALANGARVLVHDDVLATGGTARACCDIVEAAGATVAGCSFIAELAFLGGRDRLAGYDVEALVAYDSE